MTDLTDFLNAELERRRMSMRELGRLAGFSPTQVSDVINEKVPASPGFVLSVAKALGEDGAVLLRLAGHLPAAPPAASEEQQALHLFRQIAPGQREAALRMLSGLSDHSQIAPQARPDHAARMGLDPALQDLIRQIFRLMWEIAPKEERTAVFAELVGELTREGKAETIEPG